MVEGLKKEGGGSDGVYMKIRVSGSEVRFEPPLPPAIQALTLNHHRLVKNVV